MARGARTGSSGPGKHFRKGISLIELFQKFPDNETAERWFETQRWGANREYLYCPRCGGDRVRTVPSGKPMPYWCSDCRRNFSVRIASVMERSKIGYQKWAIAIYLWATSLKGVSSMKLHRDLKITQKSAYFMAQRLREAWSGGGKERNKHPDKKLRAGRGPVGKTAVVGARDRATNQVSAAVVEATDAETLQGFVVGRVAEGATVYTDDNRAYRGLPHKHEAHDTFHHISPKHLHHYVNGFAGRHNLRPQDTERMMQEIYLCIRSCWQNRNPPAHDPRRRPAHAQT